MTPYFLSSDRIERLRNEAASWLGTPYAQSGAVKQSGASCHRLSGEVLRGAGFPVPTVPERGLTRKRDYFEAMREYMEGHPASFAPVVPENGELEIDDLIPGDLLLCRIGIGHTALYLGGPAARALQVLIKSPAHLVSLHIPRVWSFVEGAYRPVEMQPIGDGLKTIH